MKHFDFCGGVQSFCSAERVSFHMPGHKGRLPSFPALYDTTELPGTDNLYAPQTGGILDASLSALSAQYGTEASLVLAGGATLALLTAVHAAVRRRGKKILSERSVHRSLIFAYGHCSAYPVWLFPCSDGELSLPDVARALRKNSDAAALVLTSPDYYGRMRDVPALLSMAAGYGIPVIVDAAHGAHLDFWQGGALSPVGAPGTLVVQSLHKTLPALTGAALLHANAGFSRDELLASLRLFASTSPSYLIALSAFDCVSSMRDAGETALSALHGQVTAAKAAFATAGFAPCVFPHADPFRLSLRCAPPGTAGRLYDFLFQNGIVCEFADRDTLVLIPSMMNTQRDFDILLAALGRFDGAADGAPSAGAPAPFPRPRAALPIHEALLCDSETLPAARAAGRIAAEPVSPYPPGVALLVPGETIDADMLPFLARAGIAAVRVVK